MRDTPEFRAYFSELQISIDAALASIDLIFEHEIVQSQSFNQMVVYLHSAADTVDKMRVLQLVEDRYAAPAALPQNRGIGRGALRVVR